MLCINADTHTQSRATLTKKIDAINAEIIRHNNKQEELSRELRRLTLQLSQERRKLINDMRVFNKALLRSVRLAHYSTPWLVWQYPQQAGVLRYGQRELQAKIIEQEQKLDKVITLQNTVVQKQANAEKTGQKLALEREKLLKTLNIKSKTLAKRLKKTVKPAPKANIKVTRKGKLYHTPIKGHIFQKYNARDDAGIVSKGITLTGRGQGAIKAAAAGKILYSGDFRAYGGLIILGTPSGVQFIYGGVGQAKYKVGQQVKTGQVIAHLPNDAAPRLYFEMRKNNKEANPTAYVK